MNVVLAWLVAEDEGARGKIQDELLKRGGTLQDLKRSLEGMIAFLTHSFSVSSPIRENEEDERLHALIMPC